MKKDTVKKCKARIQALLREILIKEHGDCEAKGEDQACAGPLQADHIESRIFANTYGDIKNTILLCNSHHFYWKKRHPLRWADLVERRRGKGHLETLRNQARKSIKTWYLRDWQKTEEKLKEILSKPNSLR